MTTWPEINILDNESPGLVTQFPTWNDHGWDIPEKVEVRRYILNGVDIIVFWDGHRHVSAPLKAFQESEGWKVALRNLGISK